ncbi:hypothetical protein LTR08_000174 [Meristemomyces frigidus]|nr:hypothetical protein LTR08_000174 [Meristemomyces frigidus]
MGEEDFFDDDDFGDIPDNTLQQWEEQAWSSTQRAKAVDIPSRPATANRSAAWRPPQPQAQRQAVPQARVQLPSAPPASAPAPPSSDYGFDDEDVIDLDEPSMVIEPASSLHAPSNPGPHARATGPSHYNTTADFDAETEAAYAAADAELDANQPAQWTHAPHLRPPPPDGIAVSSLQARIAALEADQTRLRHADQAARNAALAKQGEIAIVRANQDKAGHEYERRIAAMQKLHTDEAARAKAELDAGRQERAKLETDQRFLQHDLALEAERVKRLNGPGRARAAAGLAVGGAETPRKAKRTGLGDGFDGEDLRLKSPSKSRDKGAREQTPRQGAKRRRTANDSPIAALSFTQPSAELAAQESGGLAQSSPHGQLGPAVEERGGDGRYEFMRRLLRYSPGEGHDRSVEALTRHAFPCDPHRSLASMLLDGFASPPTTPHHQHQNPNADDLPLHLAHTLLNLWHRCLTTQHFAPLPPILDLLHWTLHPTLAPALASLIPQALPLCTATTDLIAAPLARATVNPPPTTPARAAHNPLTTSINVETLMTLHLHLAQAAHLTANAELFWRTSSFRFTLLMLNKAQPPPQIHLALHALALSAQPSSFGPLCASGAGSAAQAEQESGLVDRLTTVLFETPAPAPENEEREERDAAELKQEAAELKQAVLELLMKMCVTRHGGGLLAGHRYAVGRLVRFLHARVEELYHSSPPSLTTLTPTTPTPTPTPTTPTRTSPTPAPIRAINTTTLLLCHLLTHHPLDLPSKLAAVQGGHGKFLIALSRVAFAEGLVYERGVEERVVETAHGVLDLVLSPEEGEAVVRAVETPRGTRGGEGGGLGGGGWGGGVGVGLGWGGCWASPV